MIKNSLLGFIVSLVGVFAIILSTLHVSAEFIPNNVMSDYVFGNTSTMSISQIDSFLNSFPSSCISSNKGFTSPDVVGYNPSQGYLFGSNVSAGTVIAHAAQAYDLNPQVLLATLQKEQTLVSGGAGCHYETPPTLNTCPEPMYGNANASCVTGCQYSGGCVYIAVGYDCPNYCVPNSTGFSKQIIKAAWKMKFVQQRSLGNYSWNTQKPGWDNSDDPQTSYDGYMTQGILKRNSSSTAISYDGYRPVNNNTMSVHLDSGATASLYSYTPFTSGNTNFVNIFESWFGSAIQSVNIVYEVGDASVDSNGDAAVISIRLASRPQSTIVLNFGVTDTEVSGIIGNPSLAFTTTNWSTPQTLTVQGKSSAATSRNFSIQVLYINSPDGVYSQTITPSLKTFPMLWSNTSESAIYRLYNSTTGKHAYAVSPAEVTSLQSNGYQSEFTLGYQCMGSTNTPLIINNATGVDRTFDSNDLPSKEGLTPKILFSNGLGSIPVNVWKNANGDDTVISLISDKTEQTYLSSHGYTNLNTLLLCNSGDLPIYRLNDVFHGAHFYTASPGEAFSLLGYGFKYEGLAFYTNSSNTNPVYRLSDSRHSSHFYTSSQAESNAAQGAGLKYEGVGFMAGNSTKPVYRLNDPAHSSHFYTSSQAESNAAQGAGLKYEGAGFFLY